MKQKIVMKVQMNCAKCRSEAMKIAVMVDGVNKVEIRGEGKDQLVVTGDGVDSVELACRLRKKLQHATILTVEEEKEEKEKKTKKTTDEKEGEQGNEPTVVSRPLTYICEVHEPTSPCSIL